jgi:hypothetical protein
MTGLAKLSDIGVAYDNFQKFELDGMSVWLENFHAADFNV